MNSINDILIVLREEIDEILIKIFGYKSRSTTIREIKSKLFDAGELICNKYGEETAFDCVLGKYIYYIDNHFYDLLISIIKNRVNNSDIYQKLSQFKYDDPVYAFYKYGFYCFLTMSPELQNAVIIEKKYELFWNELYHFMILVQFENENENKNEKIRNMISEIVEKKLINILNLKDVYRERKIKQFEGRPSKITIDILLKFANYLEENRIDKKHTLKELFENAAENQMDPTTIRNWLRNNMPLLQEKKKSIAELTKDDILYMWNEYQKEKNVIKG
jgi:hypothetical protein